MKPTQEQIIAWAREAGFEVYDGDRFMPTHISDTLTHLHNPAVNLATLAYEAGRKDERARLAQPEPEPVAWWHDRGDVVDLNVSGHGIPLYFAPPQREWQGLTDEEYATLMQQADHDAAETGSVFQNLRYAIEAKLKEKNGF